MTLCRAFGSPKALEVLEEHDIVSRLAPHLAEHADSVDLVWEDLHDLSPEPHLAIHPVPPSGTDIASEKGRRFFQESFFRLLIRSVFDALGTSASRLRLYTDVNACVQGTAAALGDLATGDTRVLLPVLPRPGARYMALVQLLGWERVLQRVLERGEMRGVCTRAERDAIQRELFGRVAEIEAARGLVETGGTAVLNPMRVMDRVHRLQGGATFGLTFTAPEVMERYEAGERFHRTEPMLLRLGTAVSIARDLRFFASDLRRGRQNLLISQVHHRGSRSEKAALRRYRNGETVRDTAVERHFAACGFSVLKRALSETRACFRGLRGMGHWVRPAMAEPVVRALVGVTLASRLEGQATTTR